MLKQWISLIQKNPQDFAWEEIVRILKKYSQTIKIQPRLSFAFPTSNVYQLSYDVKQDAYLLEVGFRGLYGIDGLLPLILQSALYRNTPGTRTLRTLLDILNHHCYDLLYKARRFTYMFSDHLFEIHSCHNNRDVSLLPLNEMSSPVVYPGSEPHYRSVYLLGYLLRRLMLHAHIGIIDNIATWVEILPLGLSNKTGEGRLNHDILLGNRILEDSQQIVIAIDEFPIEQYFKLSRSTKYREIIIDFIENYLGPSYIFHFEIKLLQQCKEPFVLGKTTHALGLELLLGSSKGYHRPPTLKIYPRNQSSSKLQ